MASSNPSTARFRPATDFPKAIDHLESAEAVQLYTEIRECLIFTNRSRGQLLRRNEEHKQSVMQLRSDTEKLRGFINQLSQEKQQISQQNQAIIDELQNEMTKMSSHLDVFSKAFQDVEGISSPMGLMASPSRFYRFWQSLKALILWWREDQEKDISAGQATSRLPGQPAHSDIVVDEEEDRRNNPQMYTDPASQNRSLLDR